MTGAGQRVAIITGGSQGLGACLIAAYRRRDWAVVTNSRTIKPSGLRGYPAGAGSTRSLRGADGGWQGAQRRGTAGSLEGRGLRW